MNTYETFIAKSRYSRFLDDKQRREHWPETVERYMTFIDTQLSSKQGYVMPQELHEELHSAILNRVANNRWPEWLNRTSGASNSATKEEASTWISKCLDDITNAMRSAALPRGRCGHGSNTCRKVALIVLILA